MNEIAAFIGKEFRHIFRDVRTMLIVLAMPVVQILLFGFAISTEVNNAKVDIVADMTDPKVREMVQRLDENKYLEVGEVLSSPFEIDSRLRKGKAKAAVVFSRNFDSGCGDGSAELLIVSDASDPNSSQIISNYIKGALSGDASSTMAELPVQLMYNPSMNSSYNFVPGVMGLILMLICTMMTAVSIVREKEFGTLELVLVSPVKPFWIILSKLVPYLVLSIANFVTILLLSHFVMEVPIRGSLPLLSVVSLVFVGASLGLGLLVSTVSKTQQTALLICGMGLTMPTMMLSGFIFPVESMPLILRILGDFLPATWYISMTRKIMIQGAGFASFDPEFFVLLVMMAGLIALSAKRFKTRLQ